MSSFWVLFDTYMALAVALINLVFATFILVRTPNTLIYRIYFFICIAYIVWNFSDFMTAAAGKTAWFYLSLVGSGMLPALMFHWIVTMVLPEKRNSIWTFFAYLFSAVLSLSAPLGLFLPGVKAFVDSPLWNILYLVLLGPFILGGITLLLLAVRKTSDQGERSRLRYLLAAVIIGVFTGLSDLVPLLGIPTLPLGHTGSLAVSTILAMGVWKHREAYDVLAQMRARLESMAEMAAAIAHEIRNPLASIKGASTLLSGELEGIRDPRAWEHLTIIREEIDRLQGILETFQYFTKPIPIEKEPVSINRILEKTVKLVELNPVGLKITLDFSEHLPMVQADASLLKQVFLNLVKNACEACGNDGRLLIRTELSPSAIRILFRDNGPGIPPESLRRIFQPFFTTKAKGMGVGLAISEKIVRAHGGRIEARNLDPRGAEFSILLPVA